MTSSLAPRPTALGTEPALDAIVMRWPRRRMLRVIGLPSVAVLAIGLMAMLARSDEGEVTSAAGAAFAAARQQAGTGGSGTVPSAAGVSGTGVSGTGVSGAGVPGTRPSGAGVSDTATRTAGSGAARPSDTATRTAGSGAAGSGTRPSDTATRTARSGTAGSGTAVSGTTLPGLVSVRVETEPPGATVVLDGVRLGTSPLLITLPSGDTPQTLKVRRRGYVSKKTEVSLDRDLTWSVRLRSRR